LSSEIPTQQSKFLFFGFNIYQSDFERQMDLLSLIELPFGVAVAIISDFIQIVHSMLFDKIANCLIV
jgi:hypothetical protein